MSVTVADLLRLPSLRGAKVVGGHRGLGKIVSSISVLESTDPGVLVDEVFPQGEFYGSEIVITGFLNSIDNVPLQCANLRRLAEGGEVGLILYYVGVYLPRVDPRLIQLADELDFVLICMPEGNANLRYGEVINDVMECIFRDRARQDSSIVLDILARVSALPRHQQTVDTALKMLSDRVSASVVLCDGAFHILNLAAWPRSLEGEVKAGVEAAEGLPPPGESAPFPRVPDGRVYRIPIRPDSGQPMELLLIKAGLPVEGRALGQVSDLIRTCLNIWGPRHGDVAVRELVRAILQDEPMKMRRLAEIFRVDIAAIHEMWLVEVGEEPPETAVAALRECLSAFPGPSLVDLYEGRPVAFLSTPSTQQEAERLEAALLETARQLLPAPLLIRCGGLENTAQVREAYLCCQEYREDARRIFPTRAVLALGDLTFARDCRRLIQSGEAALDQCLARLRPVQTDNEEMDLAGTLAVFLLDGEASVTRTAERLFLHKNTVKYRLRRIADALGYRPDRMPQMLELYQAVAVRRLL